MSFSFKRGNGNYLVVVGEAGAGAGAGSFGRGCVCFKGELIDTFYNLSIDGIGQRGWQTLRGLQVVLSTSRGIDPGK